MRSRLHKGWKAVAYNGVFVGAFNAIATARPAVRMALDGGVCEVTQGSGVRDPGLVLDESSGFPNPDNCPGG